MENHEVLWRIRLASLATLAAVMIMLVASVWFGLRAYRSFLLLRSAYEVGMPQSGSIRPWMTLRYVAAAYHVPEALLTARLTLPAETPPNATLKSRAQREGLSPFSYIQRVQQAIADVAPSNSSPNVQDAGGWLEEPTAHRRQRAQGKEH